MRAESIADDLKAFRCLLRLTNASLPTLYEAYLKTARAIFGVQTALIGSYSHGIYKVLKLDSGMPFPLAEAQGRPLNEIFAEEVVRTGERVACHHIGADETLRRHPIYEECRWETYIAAPVRVNGEVFGVFSLLDPAPRPQPFSTEECEFLQLLADNLGRAIEHARLRQMEKAADRAHEELDAMFSTAFADAPIGMAVVNLDGQYLQVNAAAAKILGYSTAALLGMHFSEVTHPDDLDQVKAQVRDLLLGKARSFEMDKRCIREDGKSIWTQLNVSLVEFEDGSPRCFVGQIQDISLRRELAHELDKRRRQLEAANTKLRQLASLDSLTGLLNRGALRERLQEEMDRAKAGSSPLGFVMIDVDLFKAYNDTHGHVEGDIALRAVANCLQQCCRASDALGRFGGEEFLLILPGVTAAEAMAVAERARSAVQTCPELNWPLTVSAGVHVCAPDDEAENARPERPIALADQALYKAKQAGRNRVALV